MRAAALREEALLLRKEEEGVAGKAGKEERLVKETTGRDGFVEPFALESVALIVASFVFSMGVNLYSVPLRYYLYDVVDISARDYTILNAIESLPRSLLPLFGLLAVWSSKGRSPHKWWWCGGVAIASSAYVYLGLASTATFGAVTFWLTVASLGASLAMTMGSMMLVERTRRESESERGRFALFAAAASYAGALFGQILASAFYKNALGLFGDEWSGLSIRAIFLVVGLLPGCVVFPLVPALRDETENFAENNSSQGKWDPRPRETTAYRILDVADPPGFQTPMLSTDAPVPGSNASSIAACCSGATDALTERRVGACAAFGAILMILAVNNASQTDLFLEGCGISEPEYCWLEILVASASWLAVVLYRKLAFDADFRKVVLLVYIIRAVAKANTALGIAYGMADSAFPCLAFLGSNAVLVSACDVVSNELVNVVVLVAVSRSSRGNQKQASPSSEAVAFLTVAAVFNVCSSLSDVLDVDLAVHIWKVGTNHLEAHRYHGYIKLELLTAFLPLATLGFLHLLPPSRRAFLRESSGSSRSTGLLDFDDLKPLQAAVIPRRTATLLAFFLLWFGGAAYVLWDSITSANQ